MLQPYAALFGLLGLTDTGAVIVVGVGSAVLGLIGVISTARATRTASEVKDSTDRIRLAQEVLTETIDRQEAEIGALRKRDGVREAELTALRLRDHERDREIVQMHKEMAELRDLINRYRKLHGEL